MNKVKSIAILLLVAIGVTFGVMTGCKAKNTSQNTSSSNVNDPAKMKSQIESGLKSLVSDGTITQAQSDKVKTVLEEMADKMGSQGAKSLPDNKQRPSGSPSGGSMPNGSAPSGSAPSESMPSGNPPSGNGGRGANPLASLVSNGTITQNQADTIMQRIFGDTFGQGGIGGQDKPGKNGQNQNSQSSQQS